MYQLHVVLVLTPQISVLQLYVSGCTRVVLHCSSNLTCVFTLRTPRVMILPQMMHSNAADGKKEQVRRAATTMGGPLASLPNACISEVNLGSGMGIMINVENPSLVKMLSKVAKNAIGMFSLPLPDILVGITPTTFANTVSDPACMASVAARTANNGKGVPERTLADAVDDQNANDKDREF